MSVLGKKWVIKDSDKELSIFDQILKNRGIDSLDQELEFHDPFLFEDMEKSLSRIKEAVENKERIIIFGDYDVDGITSTAIVYHALKKLDAVVSYRLPHREKDGYGISEKFIDEFIEKEIKLIITVDCGISCAAEIKKAKDHGIDTIITDHHRIPDENFPSDAYAIIHPKISNSNYPYKELTGAGVALKLAQALTDRYVEESEREDFLTSLFDLASMGTVADLGPLTGENKYIVRRGLKVLQNTNWPGIAKLKEKSGVANEVPNAGHIGFRLAPRINSAGRIGDPYLALSLLLQDKGSPKLEGLGTQLEELNKTRQDMTRDGVFEAIKRIHPQSNLSIIVEESPDWHVGILGLIASKLAEKYSLPSIVLQDRGEFLTASARSPEFFDITKALSEFSHYLESYGGHPQAAGFTVKKENFSNLKRELFKYSKKIIAKNDCKPILEIDCEISPEHLSLDAFHTLEKLSPFGIANPRPKFILKRVKAHFPKTVGKTADHLKFSIEHKKDLIDVIAFNLGDQLSALRSAKSINLVFELQKNTWNNSEKLSLRALDFKINA